MKTNPPVTADRPFVTIVREFVLADPRAQPDLYRGLIKTLGASMGEHGPRMAIQDRLDVLLAMFAPHEKGVRYENVLFILTILPVDRQDGTLGQLAARADELARKPFVTSKELFRLINSMRRLF